MREARGGGGRSEEDVCVCVYVCVCDRIERRDHLSVFAVFTHETVSEGKRVCVCVCVCVRVCVCVCTRATRPGPGGRHVHWE